MSVKSILASTAFVAFFLGLALTYFCVHKPYFRKSFLAGFISLMVIFSLIGYSVPPLVSLHKFSEPNDRAEEYYRMYVINESGNEMSIDNEVLRPKLRYSVRETAGRMVTSYSDRKAEQLSCFIVRRANEYRADVLDGGDGILRYLRFPPHDIQRHWSSDDVEETGNFTGIRIYQEQVKSSADGSAITNQSKELVYDFRTEGGERCAHQ